MFGGPRVSPGVFVAIAVVAVLAFGNEVAAATPSVTPAPASPYPTTLISALASGKVGQQPPYSTPPALGSVSADGRYVVFTADSPDYPASDGVYLKDVTTGALTAVAGPGAVGLGSSPVISADGSTVAFVALASDVGLVPATPTATADIDQDVIVEKLATHTYSRVSHAGVGYSEASSPSISADGNSLAFETYSFDSTTSTFSYGVGARSLIKGSEVDVVTSRAKVGTFQEVHPAPQITADGSHVGFTSGLTPDSAIPASVYSVVAVGTGKLVTIATHSGGSALYLSTPLLNVDGSTAVALDVAGRPVVITVATGARLTVADPYAAGTAPLLGAIALSPDGQRLLWGVIVPGSGGSTGTTDYFRAFDLDTHAQWLVAGRYHVSLYSPIALGGPGDNQIFFATPDALSPLDTDGTSDLYRLSVG